MKNGLLKYQSINNHFNIGDYIQSLAAKQFLLEKPILINREKLNEYCGDDVKLIMNGWFLDNLNNWPPVDKINPLFVSFHLNSTAYEILENEKTVSYFKKHEPIGCRDIATRDKFIEKGIDAYFSGCLTLTLGETYISKIKTKEIFIVDPYFEISFKLNMLIRSIYFLIFSARSLKRINLKQGRKNSFKNLFRTANFYSQYIKILDKNQIIDAEYTSHYLPDSDYMTEDARFEYAKELISKYSKAKLVLTSRIHCALPCLGLETPVIYIKDINDDEISTCRLDGLLQLLNVIKYSKGDFSSDDINIIDCKIDSPANKVLYKTFKNNLINSCKNFILRS